QSLPRTPHHLAYTTLFRSAQVRPSELAAGVGGLWDFVRVAASPLLVLYAVWYLLRGRLSATGTRALGLGLAWCAVVTVQGGGARSEEHTTGLQSRENLVCR